MLETVHLRGKPLSWVYLTPQVVEILNAAAVWSHRTGVTVMVTSLNDHGHGTNSLHYRDAAVDFDTAKGSDLERLSGSLRSQLGPGYDVLNEGNHVHVEWDLGKPRSGRS